MRNYFKKFSIMFVMALILVCGHSISAFAEDINSNVKLLMHMEDSGFTDVCGHTIINNGVTLDTTNKVFGSGSAKFNGSSYLDCGNLTDWNFGSNDFTIDFRIKKTSQSGIVGILANDTSGTSGSGFLIYTNDNLLTIGCPFVNNAGLTISTSKNISDNVFHHVALIRYGTLLSVYVDGVKVASTSVSGAISTPTTTTKIGVRNTLSNYLIGNIDELEIVKGKALWTTDFTPPTSAYEEKISLNKSSIDLMIDTSEQLSATTTPASATVSWKSSDTSIATVDSSGNVTAGGTAGTCTITATINGSSITATCTVTVTKNDDPQPTNPTEPTGDANLFIELVDGQIKQYTVSQDEINKFTSWFENRDKDHSLTATYKFTKGTYKDYVVHDQIDWFEVR